MTTNDRCGLDSYRQNVTTERSNAMIHLSVPSFHRRISPKEPLVATIEVSLASRHLSMEPFQEADATDQASIA
jgi:hypothetical protein